MEVLTVHAQDKSYEGAVLAALDKMRKLFPEASLWRWNVPEDAVDFLDWVLDSVVAEFKTSVVHVEAQFMLCGTDSLIQIREEKT